MDRPRAILVWDWPTRLFHWLVVVLVAVAYFTWRANWMGWHEDAGVAVLALVLFRLSWGVAGSETARFARFVAPPRAALRHLGGMFRREPDHQVGHNQAGGWMVLLLLALLLGETLTGIVTANDVADEGPLTELMPAWLANLLTDLHAWIWDALLAAIALHVAAIGFYAAAKGHHLLRPMLTGHKPLPPQTSAPSVAPTPRALVLIACSAGVAALLFTVL